MILEHADAIRLHTILKTQNKPAYFGKDIVNEIIEGYNYFGLFPTKIISSSTYYFQSGLVSWWQNYFKWFIFIKTKTEEMNILIRTVHNDTLSREDEYQSGVYVLLCIPVYGWCLSILSFILMGVIFGKRLFSQSCKNSQSRSVVVCIEIKNQEKFSKSGRNSSNTSTNFK